MKLMLAVALIALGPMDATIDPQTALTTNAQGEASFTVRSSTRWNRGLHRHRRRPTT